MFTTELEMHTNLTKDYFKTSLSLGYWASTRFTEERKWMILKLSIWFESVQRGDFFFYFVNIHMNMRIFNSELLWNVYPYNTFKSFFLILLNPNSLQCGIRFCIPYIRTNITLDICLLQSRCLPTSEDLWNLGPIYTIYCWNAERNTKFSIG